MFVAQVMSKIFKFEVGSFVRYIHSCDTGRLEVTEIVCGGEELAVI